MTDSIEREVSKILNRLKYWQEYARKADAHIETLAEQCEHLQNENHSLEEELEALKARLAT